MQGFTDEQFDKARATGLSDSRLYKMDENAVTVNVISAIGEIIKKVESKKYKVKYCEKSKLKNDGGRSY